MMDVSCLRIPTNYGNSRLQLVHLKESRCKCLAETTASRPNTLRLGVDIPIRLKSVEINQSREILLISPCVDTVMEMYIAANQGDRDPYWTEPWPSAVCAAKELFFNPTLLSLHPSSSSSSSQQNTTTTTICELGCGLGLLGIAAALSGPYNVTLLDREPLALQCCLINAEINGVGTSAAAQGISSSSILQYLTAKERSKIEHHLTNNNSNNNKNQPTPRVGMIDVDVLDWSAPVTPRHLGTYDILLLSDVLYEKYSVEPVATIVPTLLKSNDGSDGLALLLADPPNRARMNRERFLELLQNGGGNGNGDEFVLSGLEEKVVMFEGEEKEVMLIMIKRMSRLGDTIGVKSKARL